MELNPSLFSSEYEIRVNEFYSAISRSCGIYKDDECIVLVHTYLENNTWKDPIIAITKCNPTYAEFKGICGLDETIEKIINIITSDNCTPADLKILV